MIKRKVEFILKEYDKKKLLHIYGENQKDEYKRAWSKVCGGGKLLARGGGDYQKIREKNYF